MACLHCLCYIEPPRSTFDPVAPKHAQAWIGRPYGTRVFAKPPSSGWVYLLKPTPELWTRVLLHRTQILYAADISMICSFLELCPGATGMYLLHGHLLQLFAIRSLLMLCNISEDPTTAAPGVTVDKRSSVAYNLSCWAQYSGALLSRCNSEAAEFGCCRVRSARVWHRQRLAHTCPSAGSSSYRPH